MTDTTDLEARLSRLEEKARVAEDIQAILALRAAYVAAADLGPGVEAMTSLFTEDAVWEFSNGWGVHRGIEEIGAFVTSIGAEILWSVHFAISPVISVHDETTASGKWHILQLATMTGVGDEEPDAVILSGRYTDEYRKLDGVWKFARVTVDITQLSNLDQGWVRQQFRG
jgi:hypothetical protein